MANINKIRISGTSYDIQDSNAPKVVELTKAQYDALVTKDDNTFYVITDASQLDLSQYWTSAQTQSAITESVSGKADSSSVYLKSETSGATEISTALVDKLDATAYTPTDLSNYYTTAETDTQISQATSGKTNQSDFTGHTSDTSIHVTTAQTAAWDAKSDFSGSYNDLTDKLSAGTNITIVDNVISSTGGGGGGNPTVELTQAQYDALVTAGTVSADTYYIITDAQAGDLTQYWTSAQTNSAITQAVSGKQDTLVSGTNIKTVNNTSILGSGNISVEGKGVVAGRGITVTTGATADTVSFNLPISGGTGSRSIIEGLGTVANGTNSHAEGQATYARGVNSHAEGNGTETKNEAEHASGKYNVSSSASTTFGDSGNTLFSVGNGTPSARHNAFEIRQNGNIYLNNGTSDVKLQDYIQIKVIKLTQSEYEALSPNYDSNTLYVING